MNKTYCCSDFHGCYELWTKIKNYCDDTDIIYFLGDATDRGPDGIKLMLELMMDSRVRYIRGNHEQYLIEYCYNPKNVNYELWEKDGGNPTKETFDQEPQSIKDLIIQYLEATPFYMYYKNTQGKDVFLSHAGFSPKKNIEKTKLSAEQLIFDRKHLKDKKWSGDKSTYIIHGHTPVFLLQKLAHVGCYTYCEGHKIDIDLASPFTHYAALLDLDTFEDIVFAETQVKETLD